MIIFKKAAEISRFLAKKKETGTILGFVPTMGALHQGHISLIKQAHGINKLVICSIFVNPAQFNDKNDFEKYPSGIEADIDMLEKAGCDVLFLPSVDEMYPAGIATSKHYDLGYLDTVLEGSFRTGHFQGVCQAVERLLSIVNPDYLYLGQKDYQQCMVIKKLIALMQSSAELVICPTMREADGLAMSSRNLRLDEMERKKAVRISETLSFIKQEIRPGYLGDLKMRCINYLSAEGFKVDYVEIANADNLEPMEYWNGETKLVALVAAFLNEVRLIDNMILAN
jgi:pantoate--beta-alanine ligase